MMESRRTTAAAIHRTDRYRRTPNVTNLAATLRVINGFVFAVIVGAPCAVPPAHIPVITVAGARPAGSYRDSIDGMVRPVARVAGLVRPTKTQA
jgi:hypothetical protein